MALDATVGTTTANSYVTVNEADAYFSDRSNATAWSGSTQKAGLLITSSRLLDWMLQFKGTKTSELQSMQFPRTGVELPSGYAVPDNIIPTEVKMAVFELALISADSDRVADNPLAGLEQVTAGPLTIKTAPQSDNPKNPVIPDFIRSLLSGYIASTGVGVYRLIRA
jgi:hypothetical protein